MPQLPPAPCGRSCHPRERDCTDAGIAVKEILRTTDRSRLMWFANAGKSASRASLLRWKKNLRAIAPGWKSCRIAARYGGRNFFVPRKYQCGLKKRRRGVSRGKSPLTSHAQIARSRCAAVRDKPWSAASRKPTWGARRIARHVAAPHLRNFAYRAVPAFPKMRRYARRRSQTTKPAARYVATAGTFAASTANASRDRPASRASHWACRASASPLPAPRSSGTKPA
jgi:hypothetical protein